MRSGPCVQEGMKAGDLVSILPTDLYVRAGAQMGATMNGKKKNLLHDAVLSLAACLLAATLAGCGNSGDSSKNSMTEAAMEPYASMSNYDTGDIYAGGVEEAIAEEGASPSEAPEAEVDEEASSGRKLIRNVHMDVETEDYSTLVSTVTSRVKELGGYMEQYDAYNENNIGNRGCSMTVRIPSGKLDSFVNQIGEISNVLSRSESVEDVTLQYVDMDSHKRMLREEQSRLLELLENAESMEDIIAIESRLTDVRYQLESLEAQLRTIDNQVDYSTVYLSISEVQRYTPPVEKGTWERIRIGFAENVYRVGDGLKEFFIGFVISLPVLLTWAVFIAIAALIIRLIIRAAEKGNEKRRQNRGTPVAAHPMYGAAGRNIPPMMVPGGGMYGNHVPGSGFGTNYAPSGMNTPPNGEGTPAAAQMPGGEGASATAQMPGEGEASAKEQTQGPDATPAEPSGAFGTDDGPNQTQGKQD